MYSISVKDNQQQTGSECNKGYNKRIEATDKIVKSTTAKKEDLNTFSDNTSIRNENLQKQNRQISPSLS